MLQISESEACWYGKEMIDKSRTRTGSAGVPGKRTDLHQDSWFWFR